MWTVKLRRTKDGASVAIPKGIVRLWEPYRVDRVRMILNVYGRLTVIPYTADLKEVIIPGAQTEADSGDHGPQS